MNLFVYLYLYAFKNQNGGLFSPQHRHVFPNAKGYCNFTPTIQKLRWLLWPDLRQFGGFFEGPKRSLVELPLRFGSVEAPGVLEILLETNKNEIFILVKSTLLWLIFYIGNDFKILSVCKDYTIMMFVFIFGMSFHVFVKIFPSPYNRFGHFFLSRHSKTFFFLCQH